MKFKKTKYEITEFEDEDEFIIGSVLLYEGKVANAQICEDVIGDKTSIKKVEDFLKEVKKMEWIRNEKTY